MIKVEVIEKFSLKEFNKIQNITRASIDEMGKLFVGDTFECDENMANYLLGDNPVGRAVVKVVEVEPKEETINEIIEQPIEEETEPIVNEIVEEPKEQETEPKYEKKSKKKE